MTQLRTRTPSVLEGTSADNVGPGPPAIRGTVLDMWQDSIASILCSWIHAQTPGVTGRNGMQIIPDKLIVTLGGILWKGGGKVWAGERND